jgi:hypothetical protein
LFLLALALPAGAWSRLGHRLVAEVAERELTPVARAKVAGLLRGEPAPTLAGIAVWADDLREHDPDLGKRSARWHYVNLAEHDCRYDAARDCPGGDCVVEAIRTQAAILADAARPREQRVRALKFVVHFVGDVHQPLHAGYARDRGGNDFQVNLDDGSRSGKGSNLHATWDRELLQSAGLDEKRHLWRLRDIAATEGPTRVDDAAAWAEQSCRIALQSGVYPAARRLGDDYLDRWRPLAERQVRLAGQRLAAVLNQALQ